MAYRCKKLLTVLVFIFISGFAVAQQQQIKVRFIGNCGLHLTDGKDNVYIDFPYKSGAFGYMKYDPSEIENIKPNATHIFTHWHPDHYSKKLAKKLTQKTYGPWRSKDLNGQTNILPGFTVQAFKTKHRFARRHNSYLITWHGKRIFMSGDTETAATIVTVKDIDYAFVPTWILTDAKEKNLKIDAKKFAIYHLYPTEKINVETPDKITLLDKQGEVISIPY